MADYSWPGKPRAFRIFFTRIDSGFAGRAHAAYGGVYIAASLGWLWAIELQQPDRWEFAGAMAYPVGAAIIIYGPRGALWLFSPRP